MRARLPAALLLALASLASPAAYAGPALLFDPADGAILYAEDADDQWHPASLTKIMTAYLTFRAIRGGKLTLATEIPVSEEAARQPPSKLGLPVGATISVDQALKAVIVKSANDVSVMLAEAVSGGDRLEFIALMNRTASELGMSRTTFSNPNGLPAPAQVTSARDLARLARVVAREFPQYAAYWSMPETSIGKIRLASHNGLLKHYDGADGMKTGFICDSGFNVVASATRNGRQLMAVVLGEPSGGTRTERAAALLEHGFMSYDWKRQVGVGTLDTTPIAADAKPVRSVRNIVTAWACGAGPGQAVAAKKAKQRRAKRKGKADPARADAAATPKSPLAASAAAPAADAAKPATAAP